MMSQMFKLIWNKKKANFLISLEIFLVFLILFGLASTIIYNAVHYRMPLGFNYRNIWMLSVQSTNGDNEDKVYEKMKTVMSQLNARDDVVETTMCSSNTPFGYSSWITDIDKDGRTIDSYIFYADDYFSDVLNIPVTEGRWFSTEDNASDYTPIIINKALKKDYFGDELALGKLIEQKGKKETTVYKVVGIIDYYRYKGEFSKVYNSFFVRVDDVSKARKNASQIMIKVKKGADASLEETLTTMAADVSGGWVTKITPLEEMRQRYMKETMVPVIVLSLIALFMVFNVALGMFGVLWYSINRRIPEIGLRRALGASNGRISLQMMGEMAVLTTFSIIGATILIAQLPVLKFFPGVSMEIYLAAFFLTVCLVYLISMICAVYPSRIAAEIHPAAALHEE